MATKKQVKTGATAPKKKAVAKKAGTKKTEARRSAAPTNSRWRFDARLEPHLVKFLEMAASVKRPYAIGGALAMSAHGFTRSTSDVDAFLNPVDRLKWISALRKNGFAFIEKTEDHYTAWIPGLGGPADDEPSIDLLFPYGEPEISAVETAVPMTLGGHKANFFKVDILALAKFTSERIEDRHDFVAMLKRGLFDPDDFRTWVRFHDATQLKIYDGLVEELVTRPSKKEPGRLFGRRTGNFDFLKKLAR